MSRYYFDVFDDGVLIPDEEGTEHATREQGRAEAVGALAGLVKDRLPHADHHTSLGIDMRDEDGRTVFTATVALTARWADWEAA